MWWLSHGLRAVADGGHYVPQTTLAIIAHNRAAQGDAALAPINLRGAIVGNPYTDPLENAIGMMDAAWGHGLLPTEVYEAWRERGSEWQK